MSTLNEAPGAVDIPLDSAGAFRAALNTWLDAHDLTPPPEAESDFTEQVRQLNRVRRELYAAGWMRAGWPEAVGGIGGPEVLRAVLGEEVAVRELAEPGIWSMVEVLAPTLVDFASPALAAEAVPRLLDGSEQWCQGFSEPGSGSDLASLSTRAVQLPDGDWSVTGQKVWTSLAQFAARCVLLTRTDGGAGPDGSDRHATITAFLLDMDTPGITVRPLRTMHGVDEFCEVFLDEVRIPAARMLGRPGDGWRVAMDLLPHERSTCFWHRVAHLYTRLDRLIEQLPDSIDSPDAPDEDLALGDAYLSLHTLRCRSYATQQRLASGDTLGPETSVDKVLLAGGEQQLFDTARELLPGSVELTPTSSWRSEYLYSRAATIYGGTAEVQRNIIARRLLDLGREG
jgi:alkylation response protein AidB-like acyl-CoA dehydrogenase